MSFGSRIAVVSTIVLVAVLWTVGLFGSTPAQASGPSGVPVNTGPPQVSFTAGGSDAECDAGDWTNAPTSYSYKWERDGSPILGESIVDYGVQPADYGHQLTCVVVATNTAGSSQPAMSAPQAVSGPPTNTALPVISGNPAPGGILTCTPGNWSNSSGSYSFVWNRDGQETAYQGDGTTGIYFPTDSDLGHKTTCSVTANDYWGGTTATSAPVTVTTAGACVTGRAGVSINDGAVYTKSRDVKLTIVNPFTTTEVTISSDGGFANAVSMPPACDGRYAWKLQSSAPERLPQTVYVRFSVMDSTFNQYTTFSDNIILDQTPPTVVRATVTVPSAPTATAARATYVVHVLARDAISGVRWIAYASSRHARVRTIRYGRRLTVDNLHAATWVRAIDRAGNHSSWKRVVIVRAR